jgi:hypothetical protein
VCKVRGPNLSMHLSIMRIPLNPNYWCTTTSAIYIYFRRATSICPIKAYKTIFQRSIALHIASADTASRVGPSGPNPAVCVSTTLVTPPAKSWAITGGTNAEEPSPLAFHLEILPVMALKLHGLVYLQCPWWHDYWSTSCWSHEPVWQRTRKAMKQVAMTADWNFPRETEMQWSRHFGCEIGSPLPKGKR